MSNPCEIKQRELHLIQLYSNWKFGMTPQQFYAKWAVTYEQIAIICDRSDTTVRRWFKTGKNQRYPTHNDLLHLGLMNLFLEHFEEIPEQVLQWLNFNDV